MSIDNKIDQISDHSISNISNEPPSNNDLSLHGLALLINTNRLSTLESKVSSELLELKKRQGDVRFLHDLVQTIKEGTVDGKFDCSNNQDMKDLMAKAADMGVKIKEGKFSYNKEEKDALLENIMMKCSDLNVMNDMQLQQVTRLTTERYESYQLARSIMKCLHDDKLDKARAISGK